MNAKSLSFTLPPCHSVSYSEWVGFAIKIRAELGSRDGYRVWASWSEADEARFNENVACAVWDGIEQGAAIASARSYNEGQVAGKSEYTALLKEQRTMLYMTRTDLADANVNLLQERKRSRIYSFAAVVGWVVVVVGSALGYLG